MYFFIIAERPRLVIIIIFFSIFFMYLSTLCLLLINLSFCVLCDFATKSNETIKLFTLKILISVHFEKKTKKKRMDRQPNTLGYFLFSVKLNMQFNYARPWKIKKNCIRCL